MTSVRSTRLGGCKAAAFGTLPGYHGQHLREPNVKILGQKMLSCLDSDRSS